MNKEKKTVVIVGGVAGGMSFATRYRRLNQEDKIIVVDKNPYVSFANCGLPYHISYEIEERGDLIVVGQETLEKRFQLEIRPNEEVISIDSEEKVLRTKTKEGEGKIPYDVLVLSPGAVPISLEAEGIESHKGTFGLRNIPDLDRIMQFIEEEKPEEATIVGGGFIGLEVAENLVDRGISVNMIQRSGSVLPPFDPEMARFAQEELENNGVKLFLENEIEKIEGNTLTLKDGTVLESKLLIEAIGVRPETEFLKGSGIELGMKDGIVVNENYETSVKDIYAIGDAIIVKHTITGEDAMIALASPANRQGRQLADMLSGIEHKLSGSLGTAIVRIFTKAFGSTGLKEAQLKGRNFQALHLVGKSNAGYFPTAKDVYLKVLFDKDTHEILGAQAIGEKGVDKRIDVIATAIKAGMKVEDLQELELSYAPPFGSAKDLVNMAGYFAHNVILGLTNPIQIYELQEKLEEGYELIDVRGEKEYAAGHIQGAKNIPLDELRDRLKELDKNKKYIVHCRSSVRSYNAERILKEAGYSVMNLDGSYIYYSANYPEKIEK
ncbi:FAD-dependent oxidoreductase [Peptoniphilus sp. KCTC 25270]|uniref:FAD-dependent oxidoreductase n=1 Tax=Peptoniphilus sp. KCTC 25270 TaxID=2897414 RepID=UPI001E31CDD9|nr:FAD-dependent oxidoreductase [Peptoniphilus sp. KCTC 25270]MCD1147523.1 FAD-dependent oxidoreductase [Peptoniphilus sp. KCTC 25270]